jgi:hypothetical protein
LKGRYIGECTRLVYDLIDKLEEDDIPGLLLLIDFEKTFDIVGWSFIEKTLQFYGFGPSLQKWIKAFYCDISSVVTNNGHVSELFSLRRGVLLMGMSQNCSHWEEVFAKKSSMTLFMYSGFRTLECCY